MTAFAIPLRWRRKALRLVRRDPPSAPPRHPAPTPEPALPAPPAGIEAVVAGDGAVTAISRAQDTLARTDVAAGATRLPARPVAAEGAARGSGPAPIVRPIELRRTRVEAGEGVSPSALVNEDPAWSLPDGQTLFVRLPGVRVGSEMTIRPGGRDVTLGPEPRAFTALLAAHRMSGTLELEARDAEGRALGTVRETIGPEHPGGGEPGGYRAVTLDLPVVPGPSTLVMRFVVDGLQPEAEAIAPVLFIADPMLDAPGATRGVRPLVMQADEAASQAAEAGDGGTAAVRAETGRLTDADAIAIDAGDGDGEGVATLALPDAPRIVSSGVDGMAWHLRAETPCRASLYVDGAFAGSVRLGERTAPVALPRGLLDGARHYLEIRDEQGLRTLREETAVLHGTLTPFDALQREGGRPLPGALAAPAGHRYAALEGALRDGVTGEAAAQLAHAHAVVVGGPVALREGDVRPLRFPRHDEPDVSVVVPVHGKFAVTYCCLCALLLARCEATFEVIVVDDGSTDRTVELPDLVEGIRVVRNDRAQRFIRACNAGAAVARGRYVALLNNDTEPTAGWLDALLDPFERFERVGLTGAKLLYPNGRLQEAGGIVWRSGNPWNYGRGESPTDPRYSYVREVDYVSGAAMLAPLSLWNELGGLSAYLEPMYFEDTDFAFKVREAGRRVMFVPGAVVYHDEGTTSGTDVTVGHKAHQEVNRPKFKARWATAFAGHGVEGEAPDTEKDRGIVGRVLFVDHAIPRPDVDAGSYAAVEEMKLVQSLGFKVTFAPLNMAWMGAYADELNRQGIETITAPHALSVRELLERRGAEFDAVYITRYYVADRVLDDIRRLAPQAKVLFLNADLHFLREIRAAVASGEPNDMARALITRGEELDVMRRSDVTLSYNEVEHAVIASHAPGEVTVVACPWVVRTREDVPGHAERSGTAFLGGYQHPPNREAVRWFAAEVAPRLAERDVGGTFHIYGSRMPDDIEALAGGNVAAPGFVERVEQVHDRHRSFVAPLLTGAGIKGKVLGALASGVPCVLSPIAAEGTGLRSGHDCLIAREPDEWVEAIARLDGDAELWRTFSERGRAFVAERYSFERGRETMRAAFHAAGIFHAL